MFVMYILDKINYAFSRKVLKMLLSMLYCDILPILSVTIPHEIINRTHKCTMTYNPNKTTGFRNFSI